MITNSKKIDAILIATQADIKVSQEIVIGSRELPEDVEEESVAM